MIRIHFRDLVITSLFIIASIQYVNLLAISEQLDAIRATLLMQEDFMLGHRHTPTQSEVR